MKKGQWFYFDLDLFPKMSIGLAYPTNLGEFRSLFERACVDGLFSTVACQIHELKWLQKSVLVLKCCSLIFTRLVFEKNIQNLPILQVFSEIIASPINLCSLLEDKSFNSVEEYSYVNLTTFVKTSIVHSERSLISPVLGILSLPIVQQIIQLKFTKQHDQQPSWTSRNTLARILWTS